TGSAQIIWNAYSFVYINNSATGFNQSHYFQHQKSTYTNINLENDRVFRFQQTPRNLIIRTGLYPYYNYDRINVNLDFEQLELYGCVYSNMQIYVFDTVTLRPWRNRNVSATNGLYGSFKVCQNSATPYDTTRAFFEYPYAQAGFRRSAMDFLDQIPNGMYVAITNLGRTNNTSFINQWMADTLTLGSGRSLYHKLKSLGFTQIDSFTRNLPFLYFFKKGSSSFVPTQIMGTQDSTYIDQSFTLNTTNTDGIIESPVFGPAREWNTLHWRGSTTDANASDDQTKIQVYGVKQDGSADLMATVNPAQDSTLSFINPTTYPYLKLRMQNKDTVNITPKQLRYWMVNAAMVPEGAVAPSLLFEMRDSVEQGEPINLALAFKNISQAAFDSLIKVKLIITDRNGAPHTIDVPKQKALAAGDTLVFRYTIDTRNYPGVNTVFIDFNPDNDQAEGAVADPDPQGYVVVLG
ncbi:MAG TPA: hypothetical protein PKK69_08935, partial [Ferruginibacter sp.]|nr:hypothetical protein [Ferruginibacter sp.]